MPVSNEEKVADIMARARCWSSWAKKKKLQRAQGRRRTERVWNPHRSICLLVDAGGRGFRDNVMMCNSAHSFAQSTDSARNYAMSAFL